MNQKRRIFNLYCHLQILAVINLVLLSSCITQRDLEYMRDNNKKQEIYNEAEYSNYRIKPNDALYIKISSLDDATSNVFAPSSMQPQTLDSYGAYMNSYSVDEEGYIQLPVIEKIYVLGKTTEEVGELIKDSVVNILSHPMVIVRLVNRYVTILGEVKNPGHFVYSQDKFNIYNAIGLAGDITEYGNRRQVLLARNKNGENVTINIDLTKKDILTSPYYFIQPNDIIYVSPIRKRFWGMQQFPFTIILSTISTALVVWAFIQAQ